MELFKIFFCNFVYYHRHSGNWGHYDMPVFASFIMIWWILFFICFFTLFIADGILGIKIPNEVV